MESLIEALKLEIKALTEDNIRLLQETRRLNDELEEFLMDKAILTHILDDTTEADE